MGTSDLIILALTSSVIGALISAVFTRKSAKESNDIQLMDRLYIEIERLDTIVVTLREQLSGSETENKELRKLLDETEKELADTKNELDKLIKKHERGK